MAISKTIVAFGFALFLTYPASVCCQELRWHSDLNSARSLAKSSNRPILIDFGTVNCYWCRQLDATTFRDPTVAKLLADRFVAVKIDASKDPSLAQSLGIQAFPTLIFMTASGKIIDRQDGYVDVNRFQALCSKVLKSQPPQNLHPPVTKIRMQAPEETARPVAMTNFVLPSPRELGVSGKLLQGSASNQEAHDFGTLFAKMRQMGVLGFHLERTKIGFRACIDLAGPDSQTTTFEGRGATEVAAMAEALANADSRK